MVKKVTQYRQHGALYVFCMLGKVLYFLLHINQTPMISEMNEETSSTSQTGESNLKLL